MSNSLQQVNITYNPEEDRLLLKAKSSDDSEYRVWLTRRYCLLLIEVLGKLIDQVGGLQQVSSSNQTRDQLKQGALEQAYQEEKISHYPLGENGVVAHGINTRKPDESGIMPLEFVPLDGQGLSMNMDKAMLYLMFNLLEQAVTQAQWNLEIPSRASGAIH